MDTPAPVAAQVVARDGDGTAASVAPPRHAEALSSTETTRPRPSPPDPASNGELTLDANPVIPTAKESASNANASADDDDAARAPSEATRRRRGHRAASSVWRVLTADAAPHLAIASACRHCGARVPHHHKSEKARAHLVRCAAFRQALADADARGDADFPRPDWLPESSRVSRPSAASDEDLTRQSSAAMTNKRLKLTTASPPTSSMTVTACRSATSSAPDPQAVLDALAMFIYTTGAPFADIENPHLRRALALAPTSASARGVRAQDLTGALLDRAFAAVQCELLRVTQRGGAGVVNALCVNSWLPPARESVYVVGDATSATPPLFVDAEPVLGDAAAAANAHVLFDRMARALTLCGDNIHGVVTDNSHANQLMWAKFKTIFPAKFFHGCAAHGLYLFVAEIFGAAPPTGDGESPTTAFADLRRLVEECREIVDFFNGDLDVKVSIAAKLSGARVNQLQMPPPGEWLELKAGFESVLVVLPLLQELVSTDAFTATGNKSLRERIAMLVNKSDLEMLLFKAVALVDPLDTLMHRLEQGPTTPISDVFYWFAKELPVALSRVPGLSEDEAAFLLKLNQNRFNAMYGDSHGMAYLLDPRYVGEGLSPDVRKNIEDLIFQAPLVETANKDINSDEQKVAIAQQLTEYVIDATKEKANNSFRYSILSSNKKSVLQYWLADGLRWPLLQRLAARLFALPASTLPMARKVLSVHLRLPHEELSPDVVKKIKFIQLNEALLKNDVAGLNA